MKQESTILKQKTNRNVAIKKRGRVSSIPNGVPIKDSQKPSITLNPIKRIQYVLPLGNGWVVKGEQSAVFTAITDSKTEAIAIARTIARNNNLQLIVHGKDGSVEIRENYSEN